MAFPVARVIAFAHSLPVILSQRTIPPTEALERTQAQPRHMIFQRMPAATILAHGMTFPVAAQYSTARV